MKFCKDCKHYSKRVSIHELPQSLYDVLRCKEPETYEFEHSDCLYPRCDPVTGDKISWRQSCYWLRERKDECGPDGQWWEAKE